MDSRRISRRRFLEFSAFATVAGLGAERLLASERCRATSADIEGPFYKAGAPFRTKVAVGNEPGARLAIQGTVSDCGGPVDGALVDIWQANAAGCYSIFEKCGELPGNPDEFRLRAQMKTDAAGRYAFDTVKPGQYSDGGDNTKRPSHIHYRVALPGRAGSGSTELITQLYFEGDEWLTRDEFSKKPEAKARIISLKPDAGVMHGAFHLVLPFERRAAAREHDPAALARLGYEMLVQKSARRVLFTVPGTAKSCGVLEISAPDGTRIAEHRFAGEFVGWNIASVRPGAYLARIRPADSPEHHALHVRI